MKKFLALLSSLGLAAGTIIESRAGVEVAGRTVYYAPWFLGLEALFAANALASIVSLYPWGQIRFGYLVTHSSLIVILAGALVTVFFKTEGQIGLWEGTSGNVIEQVEGGRLVGRHTLPFTIGLVDFQLERYPGTMRPSQFRSQVVITDSDTGKSEPAAIWMNHPLDVKGYRVFQSSYQQDGTREASVFSVAARVGVALLVAAVAGTASAAAPEVETLRRLPVQHDGRSMPFDTWAREVVWNATGARSWQGEDAVEVTARWLADANAAAQALVLPVNGDLAAAIGVPGADRVSFAQVAQSQGFRELMGKIQELEGRNEARHGVLADAEKLLERAQRLQEIANGTSVRPIPVPGQPVAQWQLAPTPGLPGLFAVASGPRLDGWPTAEAIDREITYNAVRPTRVAWLVLAAALACAVVGWRTRRRALDVAAAVLLVAGFAVMSWGIGTRWAVAGRVPASNMFESLLFLAWGVGLFAIVALLFIRNRLLVVNASAGAALTMALTDLLPIDGFIHPMAPVLSGTPWLAIHVPIIMVSYAVLAMGVIIAHMQIAFGAVRADREELVAKMADLNYWYMLAGSILLIAGILTGSIWAASSWGRYWGWDPKEVWSLVAFLAYMAILHGKVDRILGRFGVAAVSIVAFQTILMTYLGVNYVLGTGMHAYGFGNSPIVMWMLLIVAAEAAFLAWGYLAHRRTGRLEIAA